MSISKVNAYPTEEQRNQSIALTQKFNTKYGTAAKRISFAKNMVDVPHGTDVVDKSAFYLGVIAITPMIYPGSSH